MRKIAVLMVFLLAAGISSAFAQTRTVSGKVTSSQDGMGIPGVTVVVKGTTIGAITDLDGKYQINVRPEHRTLVFSYISMRTVEVALGNQTTINVVMEPDVFQIDEVVVTAIGVSRESKALGYAVQSVGSDAIVRSAATNPINALSGKVAGVQITNSSGAAGAASFMTIRGTASITGNNQPLFVIDGVPIDNSQLTSGNPDDGSNNLLSGVALSNRMVDLNPEDIESVNILKGGAATALYGLRAANGAVIITTKKGSTVGGKRSSVAFNSSVTFEKISQMPEMQLKYAQGVGNYSPTTTAVWGPALADLRFDGSTNNPDYPLGNIVPAAGAPAGAKPVPGYDNVANFFQTGVAYNNSIALSGGNDNNTYYLSIANSTNKGVVPKNTFDRTNISLASESKLSDKFKSETRLAYANSGGIRIQQGSNTSGVMLALMRMPPNFDITAGLDDPVNNRASYMRPDGRQRNAYNTGGYDNPFWTVNMNQFKDIVNRLTGHTALNYMANEWLTVTYRIGTDWYSDRRKQYFARGSRTAPNGRIYEEQFFVQDINSDLLFAINRRINEDITFNALLGQNMFQTSFQNLYVQGDNLTVPEFYHLSNAATHITRESKSKKRTAALFADLGVSYKNMLYFNVTGRNEWSTTLPEGNNSFFFPSFSGSFVFTELPALKENSILPYGKLRASYAIIANDAFAYATLSSFGGAAFADGWTDGISFPFLGVPGFALSTTLPNSELEPELMKSFEVGFDLKFLKNRLGLDFTYYDNKNEKLILAVPIAKSSGYYAANLNAATMVNKGIELMLRGVPVQNKNLNWAIDVNFTKNVNEVKELAEGVDNVFLAGFVGSQTRAVVGQSYGSIFGNDWKRDANGNILIVDDPNAWNYGYPESSEDETNLGNVMPDWTMGINNSLSWKGITLSFLFDIKQGGKMWNGTKGAMYFFGTHKDTESRGDGAIYVFDGVKMSNGQPNDIKVAKDIDWYRNGEGSGFTGPAGQFVESTDWVRLRELTLSYQLNRNLLKKTFLNSAELFATGRNLWLSTPYTGVDPETSLIGAGNGQGLDYFNMPGVKSYTIGLRLTL
ncbi:MAG TPA: SusC/RagA family TonB-linked outer membrane protein [Bacteroidales bacterium]|nr:SusC/RagA family TonB-linked outer membrane protein [Bacteroidales bacterium]